MKRFSILIFILACAASVGAQVTVEEVIHVTSDPVGTACVAGKLYYNSSTGHNFERIGGVCTRIDGVGSGAGTVTSVSGTANQISVATGTTTPVISLPSGLTFPGTLTSPNANPADAGIIRLGNAELIEWEKATPGADWTFGVNASDVLETNAPFQALTFNKVTITQPASGATLTIPDGVTLNAGAGGTLGSNAFNSTAFAPLASPGFSGTPSGPSWSNTGTGGLGFTEFLSQSSAPSVPASGYREYADSTGRRAWIRASDGFTRTWDATLTGNRVYTLPDANSTFPIASQVLTFSGPTAARTFTLPDASTTLCGINAVCSGYQATITFGTGAQTALGVNVGSAGAFVVFGGALGSPSSVGTLPAYTLGGAISGGANQINNIVIGASTPLAGTFTTLVGTTINGLTITANGTNTLNISAGKSLIQTASITHSGTDSTTMTYPATSASLARIDTGQTFTGTNVFDKIVNFSGSAALTASTSFETLMIGGNGVLLATLATASGGVTSITQNSYVHSGATNKYISTDLASRHSQNAGTHIFQTAPSGTAGNDITFTSRLTLGNTGSVTWSSGITVASGTPGSLCYNTSTFEMLTNNALTCTVSSLVFKLPNYILLDDGGAAFDKLRPVDFAYRDQPNRRRWGFIAEETANADRRLADGYDEIGVPRSLDQNAILAVTVKEVQRLKALVNELKAKEKP